MIKPYKHCEKVQLLIQFCYELGTLWIHAGQLCLDFGSTVYVFVRTEHESEMGSQVVP